MTLRLGRLFLVFALSGCGALAEAAERPRQYAYARNHGDACRTNRYPGRDYNWLALWDDFVDSERTPYTQRLEHVIHGHRKAVLRCYENALGTLPWLEGRLRIRLVIEKDGSVGRSEVLESTLCPKEIGCCIANAIRQWKFPNPDNGERAVFTFPYLLDQPGAQQLSALRVELSKPSCVP